MSTTASKIHQYYDSNAVESKEHGVADMLFLFLTSPMDDLISERIDRARWLLRNEPISVTAVAERCGFASIYHFSRTFKKRVGSSPTQFRRTAPVSRRGPLATNADP